MKKSLNEIMSETLSVLKAGGTILYPTDTVWGLGCDATDPAAVAKIYAIKQRSDSRSLVLLASDMDMIAKYIRVVPQMAIELVEVNDRPMTLIYPGAITYPCPEPSGTGIPKSDRYHLAYNAVASDGTAGIRIPMMDFCKRLIFKFGRPIVSTSANLSGEPAPRTFADIPQTIRSAVDYVVDPSLEAGATGLASQIIKIGLHGEVRIIRS
jgi:L-threonylcarbamoyladenylate synthase